MSNSIQSLNKNRAEKVLTDIETHLRKLISEKKELKKNFLTKLKQIERQNKENQEWFEDNWKEAERIENKLILLWDYWRREVEISKVIELKKEASSSERIKLIEEEKKLTSLNATLEQGFRKRKIGSEVIEELRKRLGIWEKD